LNLHNNKRDTFIIFKKYIIIILVEGNKSSTVEAKLVKDGKAWPLKEVDIVVGEEKVTYKIKKPARNLSGDYEIKLSNAQGESTKVIPINMQGMYMYD